MPTQTPPTIASNLTLPGGTNQALKLRGVPGGYWGALANDPALFSNEYLLEISVYNGSESIMGGGANFRRVVGMRYGTSWPNPARGLLMFKGDGTILAGDWATELGTHETEQWYDIAIHYTRNAGDVSLQYWLDGAYLGTFTSSIWDQSVEDSFDHLDLQAGAGTAYFDNIRLHTLGEPAVVPCARGGFARIDGHDHRCRLVATTQKSMRAAAIGRIGGRGHTSRPLFYFTQPPYPALAFINERFVDSPVASLTTINSPISFGLDARRRTHTLAICDRRTGSSFRITSQTTSGSIPKY